MRKFFFFFIFLLPFIVNGQNFNWDIEYRPGDPSGGCSDPFDEIVYPLDNFLQTNCCSFGQNGTILVSGELPLPQTYQISSVTFDGVPAGMEVSARVRAGVGNGVVDVFRTEGETPTLQNIFQRNGNCTTGSCLVLRTYFKFGPHAAPPNTNATATFDVNYCQGSNCDEFAFQVTVPVKLLEEPYLETDHNFACADESIDVTVKRNHIGPKHICALDFDNVVPKARLVWFADPQLKIEGINPGSLLFTDDETITVGANPNATLPVTGRVCVTHTPRLAGNLDVWYVPNEIICKTITLDNCEDFTIPSFTPPGINNLCSEDNELACFTFVQPCIERITVSDNDPLLISFVTNDKTVCLRTLSTLGCGRRTSQVHAEIEDICGNITNVTWNVRIDWNEEACCPDDPKRSKGNLSNLTSNLRSPEEKNSLDKEGAKTDKLSAYPNPFTDELTIDLSDIQGNITSIQIVDAKGSIKTLETINPGTTRHRFNLQNYQTGVYVVMVYRKHLSPVYIKVVKTY